MMSIFSFLDIVRMIGILAFAFLCGVIIYKAMKGADEEIDNEEEDEQDEEKSWWKVQEKLNRFEEIRLEINALYKEKNTLEKEIIQFFLENKENFNEIELEEHIITLKWLYEKEIDYEKLEKLYPEIYVLGLVPTFSKKHLLQFIDKEQARLVLRECTYNQDHYKVVSKRKRKKHKYNNKEETQENDNTIKEESTWIITKFVEKEL